MRVRIRRELIAAVALAAASCGGRTDPLPEFPKLMLWAWERPERLGFIDPKSAGVAFLARTVSWERGRIASRPRFQPLEAPPGTVMMAVVRLESGTAPLPEPDTVAAAIAETAALPRVRAVQVDFDATRSQRDWYAAVLARVRRRLPPSTPLTITALASWCLGDRWIRALPVSDAVPMLFRMGRGEPREVRDFRLPLCRASLGVSTDEPQYVLPHGRRIFVFNPRPWTSDDYRAAIELSNRWR